MKIGILTQPLANNYGGLLQNYALQQVLKRMGHEVETIDWQPVKAGVLHKWLWRLKERLLCLVQKDREMPLYQLTDNEEAIIGKNPQTFVSRYISICPRKAIKKEDFRTIDKEYEYQAYIVGSDQVWRPCYNFSMTPALFLSFVDRNNVRRISYAASFGTSEWEFTPMLTEECSRLLKRFDIITVREESGVGLCRAHFGVDATCVLDPTMLLNQEDYEKLVSFEKEPKSTGTLFHYILDPSDDKTSMIEQASKETGLKTFTIMPKCQAENRTRWDVKHRIEDCVFPPVTSWLRGFMDAEMVIVDSFHGAVFSIINNKPFWVISNRKRGNARFESLLGMFDLKDRMIEPGLEVDWKKTVDWNHVNDVRKREQMKCCQLLEKALK